MATKEAATNILAPGVYPGMSYAEYHRIDAINNSGLTDMLRSPAHFREALLHPRDPTEDMAFGQAFHTATIEPARFGDDYVRGLEGVGKRSLKDKALWSEFEAANPGRIAMAHDDYDRACLMAAAVWEHETSANLLRGEGMTEVVLVWEDEVTGALCKARLDRIGDVFGWTFIVDLKSSHDASQESFRRDVARYGYHRQLAMYVDGANALAPRPRRNALLVVEKTPPFGVMVYELDDRTMDEGRRQYRRALELYVECNRTGVWPGYPPGITPLSLPGWAFEREAAA